MFPFVPKITYGNPSLEPWAGGAEEDGSLRPPVGAGRQASFQSPFITKFGMLTFLRLYDEKWDNKKKSTKFL
jgi:hypothetical protein